MPINKVLEKGIEKKKLQERQIRTKVRDNNRESKKGGWRSLEEKRKETNAGGEKERHNKKWGLREGAGGTPSNPLKK